MGKEGSQDCSSERQHQKRPPARPIALSRAPKKMSCCSSCLRFPLELSMAQIALWLVAGVMLCCIPAASLEEDILYVHRGDNLRIFHLLRQLQRTPLHLCLADRNDFKFPWNRGTITQMQKTQRTCFHHLMLLQIFHLFRAQGSLAAWDHTLLSHLLSSLHHSLERLEQSEGDIWACPSLGILVRKYFQSIHTYLSQKKYSSCAWEIVRVEVTVRLLVL